MYCRGISENCLAALLNVECDSESGSHSGDARIFPEELSGVRSWHGRTGSASSSTEGEGSAGQQVSVLHCDPEAQR